MVGNRQFINTMSSGKYSYLEFVAETVDFFFHRSICQSLWPLSKESGPQLSWGVSDEPSGHALPFLSPLLLEEQEGGRKPS